MDPTLTREQFLNLSKQNLAAYSPETLILSNGGTRRRAALSGISIEDYPAWSQSELFDLLSMLFSYGVRNIFSVMLSDNNWKEESRYKDRMVGWAKEILAGPEASERYQREGWEVRAVGTWPGLEDFDSQLQNRSCLNPDGPTLWYTTYPTEDLAWEQISLAVQSGAKNRLAMIEHIYGRPITPASMYIGSGKPQMFSSIVHPILIGKMQCYWPQHLGYSLSESAWLDILYDYAFTRKTWIKDKSDRAEQASQHREHWDEPHIIGLGERLGPFWYPATRNQT